MRRSKLLVLTLALTLVATACGGGGTPTTADSGTTSTTAAVTTTADNATTTTATNELAGVELKLWGWSSSDAENSALADLISQFNADTGALAEFQPQSEYDTALNTALAGGDPPDVFYVDSFKLPDLAEAGQLAPVPDGKVTDPDDIYPSMREAFTYNGTWYCPPKGFSTLGLVYDPDALAAAGLAVPTTWEELASVAEGLTTDAQAGLAMGVEYPRWAVFLFQAGASLTNPEVSAITLDTEEARTALQFVADQYTAGSFVRPSDVDAGWAGEAYGQGKAAMAIEGNWIVGYLQDTFPDRKFAVAELPAGPAGKGTFAFTVCYGVPANAASPDASWALVEYLTNAQGALAWTTAFNVMPARASVADGWLADHPELEAFVVGAEYAHRWGFKPGFGDVIGVFNEQANAIVDGDGTVDDLIEETVLAGEDVLS
ncbi:MAG: ABC transporter substrate-binding protein [Acidimicrobiia bacterium]|nr:ABC transporter substrate-binding protein [Acidimicrobiia bacterium]